MTENKWNEEINLQCVIILQTLRLSFSSEFKLFDVWPQLATCFPALKFYYVEKLQISSTPSKQQTDMV